MNITKEMVERHLSKSRDVFNYEKVKYENIDSNYDDFIKFAYEVCKDCDLDSFLVEANNNVVRVIYYTGPVMSISVVKFNGDGSVISESKLTDIQKEYGFK